MKRNKSRYFCEADEKSNDYRNSYRLYLHNFFFFHFCGFINLFISCINGFLEIFFVSFENIFSLCFIGFCFLNIFVKFCTYATNRYFCIFSHIPSNFLEISTIFLGHHWYCNEDAIASILRIESDIRPCNTSANISTGRTIKWCYSESTLIHN